MTGSDTAALDGDTSERTVALGGDDSLVGTAADDALGLLVRGGSLGRYLLLECVGRGGMGVVFRAYDPKLRREVALKIMRRGGRAREEARIEREAQAMAQLSHPNVVAVYDVDRGDDVLYIAMEFVAGSTLRQWIDHGQHDTTAVVETMTQAARGLAVAHDAGLVHRDFKPGNVIVGDDGRVRVVDFGLARGGGEASASSASMAHAELAVDPSHSLSAALTEYGAVMGTPAYMAPEQHAGGAVDGRADQYAFCVTLYEALSGTRPFVADDIDGLIALKQRGIPRVPGAARIPGWLQRIVLRGLSPDPAARWPSMQAVVDELGSDPQAARDRRRRLALGSLAVAAVAGGWAWTAGRGEADCALEAAPQDFDDVRHEALLQGFAATGVGYAPESATRVAEALQRHAQAWRAEWQRECLAARKHGDRHEPTRCLAAARTELQAVLDTLTRDVNADTVRHAAAAVAGLHRIGDCSHARDTAEVDDAEVAALRVELANADAQRRVGRYAAAAATLESLEARIAAVDDADLAVEHAFARAEIAEASADLQRAQDLGFDAFVAALAQGRDDLAARAGTLLVRVVGVDLAHRDEGVRWARQALALTDRVDPEGELAIELAVAHSSLQLARGQTEDALASAEHGAAMAERLLGPDSLVTGRTLNHLANVLDTLGEVSRAQDAYERSLAIFEARLGPNHPDVVRPLANLANVYLAEGQADRALVNYERAIAVLEDSIGADHPDVAMLQYNAADALAELGRGEEARARLAHTIAVLTATLGPDHPTMAYPLTTLGRMLTEAEQLEAALPHLERALAIREQHNESAPLVAETRIVLAEALWHSPTTQARARRLIDATEVICRDQPEATCKAALDVVARWRAERPE